MFLEQISFENHIEFLNYFLPWNNDLHGFVFRGHADHEWKLIPSALRDLKPHKLFSPDSPEKILEVGPYEHGTIGSEFLFLREFYRMADLQGLRVPHSEYLRKNLSLELDPLSLSIMMGKNEWIPTELHELAGLAQHYGIPTRLLDWTYDPFVAIYFALKDALSRERGNLCIWCLNKKLLTSQSIIYHGNFIRFVTPSYFDNPNLNAQKGLFTHIPFIGKLSQDPLSGTAMVVSSLDVIIKEALSTIGDIESFNVFKKITLPYDMALKAYRSLHEHGYGEAKIYPGYKGIAQQLLGTTLLNPEDAKFL